MRQVTEHPVLVLFSVVAVYVVATLLFSSIRERRRGWRVRTMDRDGAIYEELRNGKWTGFQFENALLMDSAPKRRAVYLPSITKWISLPRWARDRRDEIIRNIQTELEPATHEYHYTDT